MVVPVCIEVVRNRSKICESLFHAQRLEPLQHSQDCGCTQLGEGERCVKYVPDAIKTIKAVKDTHSDSPM